MADQRKQAMTPERQRWLRFALAAYGLVLVFFFFQMQTANKERAAQKSAEETSATLKLQASRDAATSATAAAGATGAAASSDTASSQTLRQHPGQLVSATTSKYAIDLDLVGGVVNSWRLLDPGSLSYEKSDNRTSHGVEMVQRIPSPDPEVPVSQMWPLEISFKEANARSYDDFNHLLWQHIQLDTKAKDTTAVRLASPTIRGLRVEKMLDIPDDKYMSTLRVTVFNDSESPVPIVDAQNRGLTLRWGPGLVERGLTELNAGEAAYDSAIVRMADKVQVFRPTVKDAEPKELEGPIEWAGSESKFFLAALAPPFSKNASEMNRYNFRAFVPPSHKVDFSRATSEERRAALQSFHPPVAVELTTDRFDLPAKSSKTFEYALYLGPKKHSTLKQYDRNLQTAVFAEAWWWTRMIYLGLTDLLNTIYVHTGRNYGIAIMLLTVLVKILVFPLVHKSIKIQARTSYDMKRVKPYIEQINEKYKNDAQAKQRETMKVYQEHGVNPFAAMRGCIPVLPQIPIFVGLYKVANETLDLQGAKFLWIKDLSQSDHLIHFGAHLPLVGSYFNLLPIIVAFTQMMSSRLAMKRTIQTITDPAQRQMQQQMVYLIPIMVMVTTYSFPAGLMLYWFASNTWQYIQTLVTNKILDHEEAKHAKAGPPPKRQPKQLNPNSLMGKMMARAEKAKEEYERQQKGGQQQGGKRGGSQKGRR